MLTKKQSIKKRPTYEIAELFPAQGNWSEEEYLALDTNHLVEFSHGELEVLDMPSDFHQLILGRLFFAVSLFLRQHKIGFVRFSALRVRLWPGKFREPDLIFMSTAHADRIGEKFW
ncbi:MAG TPA: Uma2 family endonuclease, partial [Anaerolineales bacterium]|nr:Uma2 family endonuclease [Anaerolineales bacterium]